MFNYIYLYLLPQSQRLQVPINTFCVFPKFIFKLALELLYAEASLHCRQQAIYARAQLSVTYLSPASIFFSVGVISVFLANSPVKFVVVLI